MKSWIDVTNRGEAQTQMLFKAINKDEGTGIQLSGLGLYFRFKYEHKFGYSENQTITISFIPGV